VKLTEVMTVTAKEQLAGKHLTFRSAIWCCERMGIAWFSLEITFSDELFSTIHNYAGVRWNQISGHPLGQIGKEIERCPYCGAKIDIDAEIMQNGRRTIGISLCPWGWDYPWISIYLFGLYVCFRAQFRLHRHQR